MIKGLRSGNLLQGSPFHHLRRNEHSDGVNAVTTYGIYLMENKCIPVYEPIELSVEWLVKLGFRQLNRYAWVKNGFFVHNRKAGFNMRKNVPIKYVHELQNLFFCIKGKELEYL